MIPYRLIIALAALAFSLQHSSALISVSGKDVDDALEKLDHALSQRNIFIANRQARIDKLTERLQSEKDNTGILMQIADEYTSFNNDSALFFLEKGMSVARGQQRLPFIWKHASLLPLAGFFETAVQEYNSISSDSIALSDIASYYDSGRQMHSYISAFYSSYPTVCRQNTQMALTLQEKLLDILPKDSPAYKFNLGEYFFLTGSDAKAEVLLREIVDTESDTSNLRARAAHHLSALAKKRGDTNAHAYYLAISATADLNAATREVVALQELGSLYGENDIRRAYNYLSTALANAVECGAALRMIDTSRALPLIERAYNDNNAKWRMMIYIIIAIMGILVLGLVISLLLLRREMRKMSILQNTLRSANKTKEVYISQFLNLCSIYMDKLNQFCKIANRKLAAGQADDLYRLTKSGKFVEEQSREFYEVFDSAFLHIYPNFVEEVNRLLSPDSQIEVKSPNELNTDLRILAFMRLGIEESAKIAQVLNYSLNTIYAYRNRLKAKAIDRETFERDIMNISSVE